jgi:hypothetical protein
VAVEHGRIILTRAGDWRRLRGLAPGIDLLAGHREEKDWEDQHDQRRS